MQLATPEGLDVVKSVWSDAPLVVVEGDWMTLQPISIYTGACKTAGIVATNSVLIFWPTLLGHFALKLGHLDFVSDHQMNSILLGSSPGNSQMYFNNTQLRPCLNESLNFPSPISNPWIPPRAQNGHPFRPGNSSSSNRR